MKAHAPRCHVPMIPQLSMFMKAERLDGAWDHEKTMRPWTSLNTTVVAYVTKLAIAMTGPTFWGQPFKQLVMARDTLVQFKADPQPPFPHRFFFFNLCLPEVVRLSSAQIGYSPTWQIQQCPTEIHFWFAFTQSQAMFRCDVISFSGFSLG